LAKDHVELLSVLDFYLMKMLPKFVLIKVSWSCCRGTHGFPHFIPAAARVSEMEEIYLNTPALIAI